MKKWILIAIGCLILTPACTSKKERLYRWENLEKELHELAVKVAKEHKSTHRNLIDKTIKGSEIVCVFDFKSIDGKVACITEIYFPEEDQARAIGNLFKSLTHLHSSPTVTKNHFTEYSEEFFIETSTWDTYLSWYNSVSISRITYEDNPPSSYHMFLHFQIDGL